MNLIGRMVLLLQWMSLLTHLLWRKEVTQACGLVRLNMFNRLTPSVYTMLYQHQSHRAQTDIKMCNLHSVASGNKQTYTSIWHIESHGLYKTFTVFIVCHHNRHYTWVPYKATTTLSTCIDRRPMGRGINWTRVEVYGLVQHLVKSGSMPCLQSMQATS